MIGELAFAFTAGAVATVNPCGFVLLSAYLARRLGAEEDEGPRGHRAIARALVVGATTALGFVLVFGACGAAVVLGAAWLAGLFPWAGFVIGIGLAAIGLLMLTGGHLRLPRSGLLGGPTGHGSSGDLAFGAAYGAASLSCTLPIFLAVAGVSTTLGVLGSALNLGAYALGIATVLTAVSVAAALSRHTLIVMIGSVRPYLSRVAGGLLLFTGVYVAYFWGTTLFTTDLAEAGGGVIAAGERLSGHLRGWLTGRAGQATLYVLLAVLGALWSGMLWHRWAKAGPPPGPVRGARVRTSLAASYIEPEPREAGLAGIPGGTGGQGKHGGKS